MVSLNKKPMVSLNIIATIREARDLIGKLSASSSARQTIDDLERCIPMIEELEAGCDYSYLQDQDTVVDLMNAGSMAKVTMEQCATIHGGDVEKLWREFEDFRKSGHVAKYDRNTAHRRYMREYMRKRRKEQKG